MEVFDPHNKADVFFDGVHEVKIVGDSARIALFSRQNGTGVIVARLVLPLSDLPDVIQALVIAQTQAARK
ncbi:hypothetical protein AB8Z38_06710 [Bradyrhizobium sp. LLZ17]|uniref:Uncharacterized protein n=1 Tax=Bradyrhizobium sp. LLZ17 TaxID=3239388 RepID=A0AB39XMD3_9BRAD